MASSIFGGLAEAGLGLFGKKGKTQKHFLSDDLLKQTNEQTNTLPEFRAGQAGDLERVLAQIRGAQPQIAEIGKTDLDSLGQLAQQGVNSRPIDLAMQYGNYTTGLLDKVAANLAGLGKSADNRLLASLGHGGGGGSTFQTNTILDRISKNLAPAYASQIAGIPGAVDSFSRADAGRNANLINLVRERAGIPLRGAQAEMIGSDLRAQNMSDQIAALTGLGGAFRQNYLGSEYIPTRGEQIASGLGTSLDSVLDTGMSLYSSGLFNPDSRTTGGAPKEVSFAYNPNAPYNWGVGYNRIGPQYQAPVTGGTNPSFFTNPNPASNWNFSFGSNIGN